MRLFAHCIFSLLALSAYMGGNALVEATHHDEANILLHSKPVLASHDCGSNEIHHPVDNAQHCLACSYFAQRFFTDINSLVLRPAGVCVAVIPISSDETVEADIYHTGDRGPPSFS